MDIAEFQKRIDYKGDLNTLFKKITSNYGFGRLKSHNVVLKGYEDFNVIIDSDKGKYFVKVFANFRDKSERKQYVKIMQAAMDSGISHPKLIKGPSGYLHTITIDGATVNLVVMDYIDGKDFYELGEKPTKDEMKFLSKQAALINTLKLKPKFVYDS